MDSRSALLDIDEVMFKYQAKLRMRCCHFTKDKIKQKFALTLSSEGRFSYEYYQRKKKTLSKSRCFYRKLSIIVVQFTESESALKWRNWWKNRIRVQKRRMVLDDFYRSCFCSDHLKNGEELYVRVWFSFFLFVFHDAKSGNTNNHRSWLSDISY